MHAGVNAPAVIEHDVIGIGRAADTEDGAIRARNVEQIVTRHPTRVAIVIANKRSLEG